MAASFRCALLRLNTDSARCILSHRDLDKLDFPCIVAVLVRRII
jgi:hypothetical protein